MECTPEKSNKVQKLLTRLKTFISQLDSRAEIGLHSQVNQFYYMTRAEEIRFLLEQVEENRKRQEFLCARLATKYSETFIQWQKDARWTSLYINRRHVVRDSAFINIANEGRKSLPD